MVFDKDKLKEILDEREVKDQEGLQALLLDLTKEVIEALYEGDLTDHLGYEKHEQGGSTDGNACNGRGKKTVQSKLGEVELSPPRDRAGTFDPQAVKKRQRDISRPVPKLSPMVSASMVTATTDLSTLISAMTCTHIRYGMARTARRARYERRVGTQNRSTQSFQGKW